MRPSARSCDLCWARDALRSVAVIASDETSTFGSATTFAVTASTGMPISVATRRGTASAVTRSAAVLRLGAASVSDGVSVGLVMRVVVAS